MHAIQEEEGAIVVQSGDERSDAFANAGRSVLGDEANVGGPEFQTSDEVEGGRDQRSGTATNALDQMAQPVGPWPVWIGFLKDLPCTD